MTAWADGTSHVIKRTDARRDRINRAVYSVCALCAVGALIGVLMLAYVVGYGL